VRPSRELTADLPTATGLLDLFAAQVAAQPDTIAVRHGDTGHTYAELDGWSSALAARLTSRGVGAGDLVGLSVDPSPAVIAAILALLKVRAAYVALEPVIPLRRRRQILRESRPAALLLASEHDRYPETGVPRVWIDRAATGPGFVPTAGPRDGDLFQVVYTSGTTGRPKGVAITVGSMRNRLAWMWRDHPFPADAVLLAHKAYGLVAAPWELLGGLLRGVPTVLADHEDLLDSDLLVPMLARHRVTHLFLTPHLIELLLDSLERHPDAVPPLRLVTSGADALSPALARRFLAAFPTTTLLNLYGLTECSSNVAAFDLAALPADADRVPVGRPVAGARIAVLDSAGRPVPLGTTGEITVSGPVVAQGYWHSSGPDGFAAGPDGDRLFRTGDRGRWLRSGALEVTGRADNQVKVRGFRVELAEIEAQLARAPHVLDVAVAALGQDADLRLVAGIVGGPELDLAAVRAYARDLMPDYMVPARFVPLGTLPINANGKLDRGRLPTLLADAPASATAAVTFEPGVRRDIADLWRSLLGTPPEQADQNFFDAGGHSLLAVRFVALLRADLCPELSLRAFYENPTVDGLAARVPATAG
jgi:amino acid adenylation domain-containing protein